MDKSAINLRHLDCNLDRELKVSDLNLNERIKS